MSENNNVDFTPDAPNFKTLVRMSFQGLTNFPYIEEDFDSLTNYGLLSKVVEYLNEVISNNNEQNTLMTGLYNAYVSLQDYINDYFGNLDVQEEINNKLDEMVTTGQLQTLVNNIFGELQEEIDSIASGSPSGIYNTYQDLVNANPNHSKIYLVLSDGKWYYYSDINSLWTEGGIYQGTYVSQEDPTIKKLYNDISTVVDIPENIFPSSPQWKYGNLTSSSTVGIGGSTNRLICIPITPNHNYTIVKNIATSRFVMATVNANSIDDVVNGMQYIKREPYSTVDDSDAPQRTIEAGSNANMLLLWVYASSDTSIPWESVIANLFMYQDYHASLKLQVNYNNLNEEIQKGITIHCGRTRQYKTLKSAVEYATQFKNSTIYFDNEDFDLIEEFGDSYFENYTYSSIADGGLILKNGVHLIFASGSKVLANYEGNNRNVMYYWSPFMVGEGGFILENCEIVASRVRYCVHDDIGTTITTPEYTKFINCKMYIDNNENTAREQYECIGGGLPYSGEITIDGCIFETTAETRTQSAQISTGGVIYHNNGLSGAQSRLIVKNSLFLGERDRFGCSTLGNSTKMSTVIATNCLSKSILPTKSLNGNIDNINFYAYNNVTMSD